MTSTLPLQRNVDVLSHVNGPLLEILWFIWRRGGDGSNVTIVTFHALGTKDWLGAKPNLT
jgi:hypothetical protein